MREILGGHIVGSKAADMIQGLVTGRLLEGGYPELATQFDGRAVSTIFKAGFDGGLDLPPECWSPAA